MNKLQNHLLLRASLATGALLLTAAGHCPAQNLTIPAPRDLYADTWVATDALNRSLPVAPRSPQNGKTVAMFYYISNSSSQHLDLENSNTAHQTPNRLFDISRLLAANPENPAWGPQNQAHWWGEPLFGYYVNDDPWVIRHHLSMLSDAGVDVLFFDMTNSVTYRSAYIALCKVALQMRREGNRTPQIAFFTHARGPETVTKLYQEFYKPNRYTELWFKWDGKPLIIGDRAATYNSDYDAARMTQFDDEYLPSPVGNWKQGDALPAEIQNFFTWRDSWAWSGVGGWYGNGRGKWPWLDNVPQAPGLDPQGQVEQIVVSPAQHPTTNKGRSYSNGQEPPLDRYGLTPVTDRGVYFAEQWQRALAVDPPLLWVTQWNEWTAMRLLATETSRPELLGRPTQPGQTFFVDVYNREFSRDLEPMQGGWGDNYYFQLADGIRRFKGARPTPVETTLRDPALGDWAAWDAISAEYRDTIGDNASRDWPGWGGNRYVNRTGRNDIMRARVAAGRETLHFYVQTRDPLTSRGDGRWMQLLINSDQNAQTGWQGYDVCVNSAPRPGDECAIARWENGQWTAFARARLRSEGNQLHLIVPRAALNQTGRVAFDFHWVDNAPLTGNLENFWVDGDSAPNGRFNYRYQNSASP